MRLIGLAVVLAVGLVLAPLAVEAQQPGQMYRIGFLSGTAADAVPLPKLRAGLRELGYVEGKTITFEYRFAEDKNERLSGLAAELVRSKVDIIVAHGSPAIHAAKEATSTIPVVMVGPGDPVGTGFVASLARPGATLLGCPTPTWAWPRNAWSYLKQPSRSFLGWSRSGILPTQLPSYYSERPKPQPGR